MLPTFQILQKLQRHELRRTLSVSLVLHLVALVPIVSAPAPLPSSGTAGRFEVIWGAPAPLTDPAAGETAPATAQAEPADGPGAAAPGAADSPSGVPAKGEVEFLVLQKTAAPHRPAGRRPPATPPPRPHRTSLRQPPLPRTPAAAAPERVREQVSKAAAAPEALNLAPPQQHPPFAEPAQEPAKPAPPVREAAEPEPPRAAAPAALAPGTPPAVQVSLPPEKPQGVTGTTLAPLPHDPQPPPVVWSAAGAVASAKNGGKDRAQASRPPRTVPRPGAETGSPRVSRPAAHAQKPGQATSREAPLHPRSAQPEHPAGPGLPALTGELKLQLDGDPVQVRVRFRPYPRARRSAAPDSERPKEETIAPKCASTGAASSEAVVGLTREGVYTFILETGPAQRARVSATLKIYEATPKERRVRLGRRTVTGSSILFKVLMPEGVLWDDDSSFTGSIEDSDSEVKFNADTGLFWREFKP